MAEQGASSQLARAAPRRREGAGPGRARGRTRFLGLSFAPPPRKLRITREGWVFLLVTLGVGAAAVNTGNNLLFLVLGLLLSLIVISGLMSESTLRRIHIERHVPARIHAGSPSLVEVTLHNRKARVPSYSVELEDLLDGWSTDKRCYFLKVAAQGQQTAAYRTVIPRRGTLRFTGYRVATRFPFSLFEKWREFELPAEVVVYPELVEIPRAVASRHGRQGEVGRRRPGQGDELHGLHELRPGDDVRAIHWRTSARLGRFMVREHEEEQARHLAIYLDNARSRGVAEGGVDPVVERAISIAASLVTERAALGQGVYLSTRSGAPPPLLPGHPPDPLLRFLALLAYAPPDDPPPFARLPRGGEPLLIAEASRAGGFEGAVIGLEPPGAGGRSAP